MKPYSRLQLLDVWVNLIELDELIADVSFLE